jgi:uncharacterized protein involved in exopolysaccharide biosynthesis
MADSFAGDAAGANSDILRDALRPLREHMAFIVVFVVSAMLSALALTYMYSERYRAEATIFFKPAQTTKLTQHTTEALGAPFPSNTQFIAVDKTITQLLDSDALLRQVVADLNLQVPQPRDKSGPWYVQYYTQVKNDLEDFSGYAWDILRWGRIINDPVAGAIARLRGSLKVASNDSYVYNLTVSAITPERAKAIADALATRLIDTMSRIDLGAAEERQGRLGDLRDDKGSDLENIEEQLRDLQARNHVASVPDELTEATSSASHFQRAQADATADLHESDSKVAELTARTQVLNQEVASAGRDLSPTARLSRLSANDYTRLTSDKLDAQVRSRGLNAKLAQTDQSYTAASTRLQVLAQVQAKYDFLSARLAAAKRDYAALSDAYEETVIETTTGQSQLHLQAKATAVAAPISPIKIYHVGAAGALALVIALGLAYVLDYFDINLFLPPASGEEEQPVTTSIPVGDGPGGASARVILNGGDGR